MSSDHADHDVAPMSGAILWLAGFTLALGNFVVVLDTTIANVSVPHIAGGLAVSPDQGTWVITSYSVAEAITVPLTGWLAQRFGAVKVFAVAMFAFGVFSAMCGLAPTLGSLVLFRVLQGLSGGPMMPLSQALMRRVFPVRLQPMAFGLWAMTTVTAPIAGPLLGGIIVDTIGWPWIFYINVPVAVLMALAAWRLMQTHETPIQRRPIDVVGMGLMVIWIGAMQIMLDKGKDLDWFGSPFIVALALIAGVGFVAFLIWELTDANPAVDLRIFGRPGFAATAAVNCLAFGSFFSVVVLVPLWLQTTMGYTATSAGRVTAFQGVGAIIFSPIVARLMGKIDPRFLVFFGVCLMAVVSTWRAGFDTDAGFWAIAAPQFMLGVCIPFFFVPITVLALNGLKPSEVATAAGLLNFTRTTGAAFAVSIVTTVWGNAAAANRTELVGALNDPAGMIRHLGLPPAQAVRGLDSLVQAQSVMLATDQIFAFSAVLLVCVACLVFFVPKPVASDTGPHATSH